MLNGEGHFHFAKGTSVGKSYSQLETFEGHGQDQGQRMSWSLWPPCNSRPATHKPKGQVTQASITRTKTITVKMHALDWLDERGRILCGSFQPIEGVHFYRSRSRYRGLCDWALTAGVVGGKSRIRPVSRFCNLNPF